MVVTSTVVGTRLRKERRVEKIVISYRGRKTMSFFGTSPRAQPEGECLKNHRFECEVRSLLFAAESKKQGQKGPFLTSPDASKNTFFETPWQKIGY